MSAVVAWVREIVLVVLLGWVLGMLVPRDDFRRYVHLVIGLLVLVAVIRPALDLLGGVRPGTFTVRPDTQAASLVARGVTIQRSDEAASLALFARKVGDEAAAVALTVPGVVAATGRAQIDGDPTSSAYGEVTSVEVRVTPGSGGIEVGSDGSRSPPKNLASRVQEAVAKGLAVEARAVSVQVVKGG